MLAKFAVSLAAAAGLGIGAVSASGASLVVKVAPSTVHPGRTYTVTISGSYDTKSMAKPPYLLAFIQYMGSPCRATATAEYRLPESKWDWDYRQHSQPKSPFRAIAYWTAGPSLGSRRVCAYLYRHRVSPASSSKPLVWATASFTNTRAPTKPKP